MMKLSQISPTSVVFAFASLLLAYEPILWLVGSWRDPSYASNGIIYLGLLIGLLIWSLSSPVRDYATNHKQLAVLLLFLAALIRLVSQVLAINVIGGLALAIDIFALATFFRVGERVRALSPFWLSILFLFTLPVERILQRLLGYPLQELSAKLTCSGLGLFFSDLSCSGIRIELAGKDVLVDLPCSGTSGLMLAMAFVVLLNALYRPSVRVAFSWICVGLVLSLLGNAFRIALLAVGIAFPGFVFGADVMAQPLNDIIGYVTLGISVTPLFFFYKPVPKNRLQLPTLFFLPVFSKTTRRFAGLIFLSMSLLIVSLPRHAFDVSETDRPQALPLTLNGEIGKDEPLLPVEERYFEQYGGHAQKRRYGPLALTMVHTTSPLRHLHAPDDCLRGLGYEVTFLGTRFAPVPTAIYRARSSDGGDWRVSVTFVSSNGDSTHNIAEAIWLWLQQPGARWTSIQRITPWSLAESQQIALETATQAALDLSPSNT